MYFKEVISCPRSAKAAVKASLDKWQKILEFCETGEFPESFCGDDVSAYTCSCCMFWYDVVKTKRKIPCPLDMNPTEGNRCGSPEECNSVWLLFFKAFRKIFRLWNGELILSNSAFKNHKKELVENAREIVKLLEDALKCM